MQKNKALKVLGNLDMVFAGVLMVGLIVLTFVGVIRRYFLRDPITWMEEVQMLLFLWVVFLGGSAAFRTGSHIAIEIVVDALPKKIGGFMGYLFMQEWSYYYQLMEAGKVTTLLRIPYSIVYLVVPVGGILMIVSMLFAAYRQFIAKKPLGTEETEA